MVAVCRLATLARAKPMPTYKRVLALLPSLLLALVPTQARGNELIVATGLEAQASSWSNDHAGAGTLKFAYQWDAWSTYFLTELGIASVDERVLEHLELGAAYRYPIGSNYGFIRAGLTHRHEVPGEAIDNSYTTLLGFGDGIRHRAGAAAGAGFLFPFARYAGGEIFVSLEANVDTLAGAAGPTDYWGAGFALGYAYDLSARR